MNASNTSLQQYTCIEIDGDHDQTEPNIAEHQLEPNNTHFLSKITNLLIIAAIATFAFYSIIISQYPSYKNRNRYLLKTNALQTQSAAANYQQPKEIMDKLEPKIDNSTYKVPVTMTKEPEIDSKWRTYHGSHSYVQIGPINVIRPVLGAKETVYLNWWNFGSIYSAPTIKPELFRNKIHSNIPQFHVVIHHPVFSQSVGLFQGAFTATTIIWQHAKGIYTHFMVDEPISDYKPSAPHQPKYFMTGVAGTVIQPPYDKKQRLLWTVPVTDKFSHPFWASQYSIMDSSYTSNHKLHNFGSIGVWKLKNAEDCYSKDGRVAFISSKLKNGPKKVVNFDKDSSIEQYFHNNTDVAILVRTGSTKKIAATAMKQADGFDNWDANVKEKFDNDYPDAWIFGPDVLKDRNHPCYPVMIRVYFVWNSIPDCKQRDEGNCNPINNN